MARRNISSLTTAEWNRVVAALQALKSNGTYDAFTRRHVQAMQTLTLAPGETGTSRNVAHRGPAFLPWHRQSLLELDQALQSVDRGTPKLELPYWRWDTEGANWQRSAVWSRIGGNGSSTNGYRITTGPFRNWTSVIWSSGSFRPRAGIIRRWSAGTFGTSAGATSRATYDTPTWNERSDMARSHRRFLEESLHNFVHVRIGGDMETGTSPNDPVFWLHHCNVDRIWAEWQVRYGLDAYLPTGEAPAGHNLDDPMRLLLASDKTPASVLDFRALGATYDTIG